MCHRRGSGSRSVASKKREGPNLVSTQLWNSHLWQPVLPAPPSATVIGWVTITTAVPLGCRRVDQGDSDRVRVAEIRTIRPTTGRWTWDSPCKWLRRWIPKAKADGRDVDDDKGWRLQPRRWYAFVVCMVLNPWSPFFFFFHSVAYLAAEQ